MSKTNESLLQRRQAAVPRGVGQIHPVVAERAENATVWDVEGREYIDFAGGIAVLNTGHLHPKVVAAVQEQLTKLSHTCFQVLAYEPYIELAEEIAKRVPGVTVDPLLERYARKLMARNLANRFTDAAEAMRVLDLVVDDPGMANLELGVTDVHRASSLVSLPLPKLK